MESSVTQLPKSTVRLTVSVLPVEMSNYFAQAAELAAGQANIPGFRKGKAPRQVVESRLGKNNLAHQAFELALSQSYFEAIKKHDLKPIGQPKTDLTHEHDDLETKGLRYTAEVPVLPPVDLGGYQKIKVKPAEVAYSDKLIAEALAQLQRSRASFAQADRPAAQGDRVEIDFVGKKNGQAIPDSQSSNHPLVIGEDNFVPGFSEQLVGMRTGQVKEFRLPFPKDYHVSALAGQPIDFTVTVKQVQAVSLPKLDDAFAGNFGAKTLADLKKRLASNLKQEKTLEAKRQTEQAVVEKVLAQTKVEVPGLLVDDELTRMLGEFRQQVESQGIKFDQYLGHLKKTEDELRQEQQPEAVQRVKTSLVLQALQEAEQIKPTEQAVQEEIDRQLTQAPDQQTKERIKGDEFRTYVRRILGNRLAVQRLVKYATR